MNILSILKGVKASDIPFKKLFKSLTSQDSKDREASVGLLKIYSNQIDRIFEKILMLFEDDVEEVRKKMEITMVDIIKKIGLERIISNILKQLTDNRPIEVQRSFALILQKTIKNEDEKIKKRVVSLLKRGCEMSQDPIICKALHKIQEG